MILKGLVKTFFFWFVPFSRELQTLNIILALMPQSELFPSSVLLNKVQGHLLMPWESVSTWPLLLLLHMLRLVEVLPCL